jgi:hypothetical protein
MAAKGKKSRTPDFGSLNWCSNCALHVAFARLPRSVSHANTACDLATTIKTTLERVYAFG